MPYKYILFDLDGTLFDYNKAESAALQKTFEHFGFGFKQSFLQTYRAVNSEYWHKFEKGTISLADLKVQRFADFGKETGAVLDAPLFSKKYLENLSCGTFLLDGAEALLEKISGRHKLYLITNGITSVQRPRIAASSIAKYFNGIIISEETGFAKPDSRIFDAAFKMMGNPHKLKVLIVGDSLSSDIAGGSAYGIDTCWYNADCVFNTSKNKISFEISCLLDLLPILNGQV